MAGAKILETLAAMLPSGGIKAFHSSPHDFDKFDLSKLRSGQGANTYGSGLYFAENPAISGQGGEYWKEFKNKFSGSEGEAASFLERSGFDRDRAVVEARKWVKDAVAHHASNPSPLTEKATQHYQDVLRRLESSNPVGPRTYEVNIRADPSQMLNWDVPIGQQSNQVIDAVRPLIQPVQERQAAARARMLAGEGRRALTETDKARLAAPPQPFEEMPGSQVYKLSGLPAMNANEGAVRSTERLNAAGVPGVRYLDQGSRQHAIDIANAENAHRQMSNLTGQAPEWAAEVARLKQTPLTSNYVVFNDKLIDIMKKYAVPGAAGGIAAAGSNLPTWDARGL